MRGKDQHARFMERRGAFIRDTTHRTEGQLKEEGIEMNFSSTLAKAVLCENGLLSISGSLQRGVRNSAQRVPQHPLGEAAWR